jgi:hypothetical protein
MLAAAARRIVHTESTPSSTKLKLSLLFVCKTRPKFNTLSSAFNIERRANVADVIVLVDETCATPNGVVVESTQEVEAVESRSDVSYQADNLI